MHLVKGLSEPNSSIRVAIAYAASRVAHMDWPHQWPSLMDELMSPLQSDDPASVHGAMRVVAELIRDDITDQQLPSFGFVLLPQLFRVFVNEKQCFPTRMRAKTVSILRDFVDSIYMLKDEHPDVVPHFLQPMIATWMDAFRISLALPYSTDSAAIKCEVLRTVVKLARGFPKLVAGYLVPFTELIWRDLLRFCSVYEDEFVISSVDAFDSKDDDECDSDGEALGIRTILFSLIEFMQLASRRNAMHSVLLTVVPWSIPQSASSLIKDSQSCVFLRQLIHLMLLYLRISTDLEIVWLKDMNQFIQDDEEDSLTFNVRVAIQELLATLVSTYRKEAIQALCESTTNLLQIAQQKHSASPALWWKTTEACLLALGLHCNELVDAIQSSGSLNKYDLNAVFQHFVIDAVKSFDFPFLQGRALWFSGRFAEVLPSQLANDLLHCSVSAICQQEVRPTVRICALKAIRGFCTDNSSDTLSKYQGQLIDGMTALAANASEDSLSLIFETMMTVVSINPSITVQYEPVLSQFLMDVWARTCKDLLMADLVEEMFKTLCDCHVVFQERMFPHLAGLLTVESAEGAPESVVTALSLLAHMMRRAPDPFPRTYITEMFPRVMSIAFATDDAAILQNVEEVLKQMVQRDIQGLIELTDSQQVSTSGNAAGTSGLEYLIRFVAKMLQLGCVSESAAMYVGELISKLIQKAGHLLTPMMPDLLTAVILCLQSAKTPTFVQQLVLVFAQLIQTQADTVIEFLATCPVGISGETGLAVLLKSWCDNFEDFHGVYATKLSTSAMILLFSNTNPALDFVQVKGDLIVGRGYSNSDVGGATKKIVTRSMTKRMPDSFTSVPFRSKALQLIFNEYLHQVQLKGQTKGDGKLGAGKKDEIVHEFESEDDEEEWEEDEEDGDGLNEFDMDQLNAYMYGDDGDLAEDEEDEDIKNDRVYQLNLKVFLLELLIMKSD